MTYTNNNYTLSSLRGGERNHSNDQLNWHTKITMNHVKTHIRTKLLFLYSLESHHHYQTNFMETSDTEDCLITDLIHLNTIKHSKTCQTTK